MLETNFSAGEIFVDVLCFRLRLQYKSKFRVFAINHIASGDICGRTRWLIIKKRNNNKGTNGEKNSSRGVDWKDQNHGIRERASEREREIDRE